MWIPPPLHHSASPSPYLSVVLRRQPQPSAGPMPDRHGQPRPRSRRELVADHEMMLRMADGLGGMQLVAPHIPNFPGGKPSPAPVGRRSPLRPLLVRELRLGTHAGRVLEGTLIVAPGLMQGVNSILEDKEGEVHHRVLGVLHRVLGVLHRV